MKIWNFSKFYKFFEILEFRIFYFFLNLILKFYEIFEYW
jgi:hypothetical protein